jgi:tRNA (guanine37-N1)-methyltransferase
MTIYGGGAGMVVSMIDACITHLKSEKNPMRSYMSPDGETNQKNGNTMSMYENIIILCGRYKGVDQRVRPFITKENI